jgi:hypothetical protein
VYDEKGVADDMLDFLWEFFKGGSAQCERVVRHAKILSGVRICGCRHARLRERFSFIMSGCTS